MQGSTIDIRWQPGGHLQTESNTRHSFLVNIFLPSNSRGKDPLRFIEVGVKLYEVFPHRSKVAVPWAPSPFTDTERAVVIKYPADNADEQAHSPVDSPPSETCSLRAPLGWESQSNPMCAFRVSTPSDVHHDLWLLAPDFWHHKSFTNANAGCLKLVLLSLRGILQDHCRK